MIAASITILPLLLFFVIPLIIAIVIICVIAKRKRKSKTNVTANVTIQSPGNKKFKPEKVEPEKVEPIEETQNEIKPVRTKPKSNLAPILICVIFLLVCAAIAVWSFMG